MDVRRTPAETAPGESERRSWLQVSVAPGALWLIAGIALLFICIGIVLLKGIFVFLLLFTAIVFAEGIRPVVDRLQRWHAPRPLAVLLVYLCLALILALLIWILLRPLIAQVTHLVNNFPSYMNRIGALVTGLEQTLSGSPQLSSALDSMRSSLTGLAGGVLSYAISLPQTAGSILLSVVLVAVMAFFWLTGVEDLKPLILSVFPEQSRPVVSDMLIDMGIRLSGYVRGVGINMLVIGILSGGADWLLGIPYPTLLGIVAGLMEIIPYFGPWISGGIAAIVALVTISPIAALEVIVAYILIQQIEGHVLIPYVMMRTVKINPLTVVIAVLLGTELLGIIGGILALPVAAVVEVVIMRAIVPALRRRVDHSHHVPHAQPAERPAESDRRSDQRREPRQPRLPSAP
jgi:predicted PurR-regulated permease PerM